MISNEVLGKKIAVIFSTFGQKNHNYLKKWFFSLQKSNLLRFQIFESNWSGKSYKTLPLKIRKRYYPLFFPFLFFKNTKTSFKQAKHAYLINFNPDATLVIFSHLFPGISDTLFLLEKPFIVSFRGYDVLVRPVEEPSWNETLNLIFTKSFALHFVSDFIKNQAIKLGAPPQKCHTIYRSIDLSFFKPKQHESINLEYSIITTVARLTWQKGYLYNLEALSILKKKGIKFKYNIIGEGPDYALIKYHIDRLGLNDQCLMHGQMHQDKVQEILYNSDIYLQASISESMGNSYLEASASGLPIVATNIGGIPEVVLHNKTGYLADPCDTHKLSFYIEKLITDPQLRKNFGTSGRVFVEDFFSPQVETENWLNLFSSALIS